MVTEKDRKVKDSQYDLVCENSSWNSQSSLSSRIQRTENLSLIERLKACSQQNSAQEDNDSGNKGKISSKHLEYIQDVLFSAALVYNLNFPVFRAIFKMVAFNILRPLYPLKPKSKGEDEELLIDPDWVYLRQFYDILLSIVIIDEAISFGSWETGHRSSSMSPIQKMSSDTVKASRNQRSRIVNQPNNFIKGRPWLSLLLDENFLQSLVQLFLSQGLREREYLKSILLRLYRQFPQKQQFIMDAIKDMLSWIVYENAIFDGSTQLLETCAPIIYGYQIPLKVKHKTFFKEILLPLYATNHCELFFDPLFKCTAIFCTKDPLFSILVLETLLKCWPNLNTFQEVYFFQGLQEMLEMCHINYATSLSNAIIERLQLGLSSHHLTIVDRAMHFFETNGLKRLLETASFDTLNNLEQLVQNLASTHWIPNFQKGFQQVAMTIEPLKNAVMAKMNNASECSSYKINIMEQPQLNDSSKLANSAKTNQEDRKPSFDYSGVQQDYQQ